MPYQHFRIVRAPSIERYLYPQDPKKVRGPKFKIPTRDDRATHGANLRQGLQDAIAEARGSGHPEERDGITLEFIGEPTYDLMIEQLDLKAWKGIELSNVRRTPEIVSATVYVPPGKISHFFRMLEKCSNDSVKGRNKPPGQKLFDTIASIRRAAVRAFWTDQLAFPEDAAQLLWWEVWIRSGSTDHSHNEAFGRFAAALGDTDLQPGMGFVQFPERLVLLVRGSVNEWSAHPEVLNLVAELRQAKDVPTDFIDLSPDEQRQWVDAAATRVVSAPLTAPAVCVLDTGIWRDHPLINLSLSEVEMHAIDAAWGNSDHHGHGTSMAGLALYGQDLQKLIEENANYTLTTRLESVKILPPRGANDPANHGYLTQQAVARAEIAQPHRPRTVCLATTADDRDQGYPSSWSAAIDSHCFGALDDHQRLYVVSVGNCRSILHDDYVYPNHNHSIAGIQDPSQSWNAITVGSYTDRVHIQDGDFAGWNPIAPAGGLSPTSCTSIMWTNNAWPLKPDIVMEGGNWAKDADRRISPCSDLELLTTAYSRTGRLFDTMRDTSAATAQAARMCAQIQARYPELWPETVRALLIHSARWSNRMRIEFPGSDQNTLRNLIRCYGYGVPDLNRAVWSLENQVCLIAQKELQPFERTERKNVKSKDMHIHSLPWPVAALQDLGQTDATIRITLSYFIDPSPGRRGWTNKFGYQSHGLRFKLRGPLESEEAFRRRISREFWDDDVRPDGMNEPQQWALGSAGLTNRGSIHSNWWKTSGAELAACGEIAVYPVGGWWKQRKHLEMFYRSVRYSLVISIETRATEVRLYSAIANLLNIPIEVVA